MKRLDLDREYFCKILGAHMRGEPQEEIDRLVLERDRLAIEAQDEAAKEVEE